MSAPLQQQPERHRGVSGMFRALRHRNFLLFGRELSSQTRARGCKQSRRAGWKSRSRTLLQKLVTDKMRGRVLSLFMLSFIGAMPIGNLIAGAASQRFGAPRTLAVGGLIIIVFVAMVTWRNPRLREL